MNNTSAAIRLKLFMDHHGLSNSQFADSCGIPRPTLSQLLSGRNKKLSDQVLAPIHRRFPQLSIVWLMFGEGDMLNAGTYVNSSECHTGNGSVVRKALANDDVELDFFDDSDAHYPVIASSGYNSDNEDTKSEIQDAKPSVNSDKREGSASVSNTVVGQNIGHKNPLSPNLRRARRIRNVVIYYDDNTYETFYPRE